MPPDAATLDARGWNRYQSGLTRLQALAEETNQMTQSEQEKLVKDLGEAFEPFKKRVESKELDCALVAVTGGMMPYTFSWYLEAGNWCAIRELAPTFLSNYGHFELSKGNLDSFMPLLSSDALSAVIFLGYRSKGNTYVLETLGIEPACTWLIREYQIRSDQIMRTEIGMATAANVQMRQAAGMGIIKPSDLRGPNLPFGRN